MKENKEERRNCINKLIQRVRNISSYRIFDIERYRKIYNDYTSHFLNESMARTRTGDDIPISILNNEVAKAFYGVVFEKIKKYDATKDSAAELALKIDKIILDNHYVDWIKNTDLQNKIINDIEDVLFEFKDINKIDITFDDIDFIIDESMKIAKRRYAK